MAVVFDVGRGEDRTRDKGQRRSRASILHYLFKLKDFCGAANANIKPALTLLAPSLLGGRLGEQLPATAFYLFHFILPLCNLYFYTHAIDTGAEIPVVEFQVLGRAWL